MKSLPQEEWDFSGIADWEVRPAIYFEAVRTRPDLVDQIVQFFSSSESASKGEFPIKSHIALNFFKVFRPDRPWRQTPRIDRVIHLSHSNSVPGVAMVDLPDGRDLEFYRRANSSPSLRALLLLTDLSLSNSALAEAFINQIENARRRHGIKEKSKRGKQSSTPFAKLKWLSAYRLDLAGFNFEEAQNLLKLKDAARVRPREDVWPVFGENPAWRKAVRRGRALVEQCTSPDLAAEFL